MRVLKILLPGNYAHNGDDPAGAENERCSMILMRNAITTATITVKATIADITMAMATCAATTTVKALTAVTRKAMRAAAGITESNGNPAQFLTEWAPV